MMMRYACAAQVKGGGAASGEGGNPRVSKPRGAQCVCFCVCVPHTQPQRINNTLSAADEMEVGVPRHWDITGLAPGRGNLFVNT